MTDLREVLSDEDREWAAIAEDTQLVLHEALDSERPVDFDRDDYRGES